MPSLLIAELSEEVIAIKLEVSIQEGSHPGEGISHILRPYRQRLQQSKYEVVNAQTNTVKENGLRK